MLTRKQKELLLFIDRRLKEDGVSPSFDEMREALSLASKSGIHRLITALEERGFIRRLAHRARALEVLKLPDDTVQPAGFQPRTIQGGGQRAEPRPVASPPMQPSAASHRDGLVEVPLIGRIAAGSPIEAIQQGGNHVALPPDMLGAGEHFALTVRGDSMIDAGIHDGDIAVLRKCDTADNGAIVCALVDEEEATLKRIRRKGGSIALEAANPDYETRIFGPDRVRVQGRLVSLLRKYD
jgi:repressor LexA